MINSEVKDDVINLSLNGDYMTIMTELVIIIVRLTYDQPETIDYIVDFLNVLEQDVKNGTELDTVLTRITQAYVKCRK